MSPTLLDPLYRDRVTGSLPQPHDRRVAGQCRPTSRSHQDTNESNFRHRRPTERQVDDARISATVSRAAAIVNTTPAAANPVIRGRLMPGLWRRNARSLDDRANPFHGCRVAKRDLKAEAGFQRPFRRRPASDCGRSVGRSRRSRDNAANRWPRRRREAGRHSPSPRTRASARACRQGLA